MELYHVTTPKKAKGYYESGYIKAPIRGFATIMAAMAWAIKTGRTVIYQIKGEHAYKLSDHHNSFSEAWWIDENVPVENIRCVFFGV